MTASAVRPLAAVISRRLAPRHQTLRCPAQAGSPKWWRALWIALIWSWPTPRPAAAVPVVV